MVAGAVASAKRIEVRQRWERSNTRAGIMLDWDDVQAVVTRALSKETPQHLLAHFREHGATHLSMPELTLGRLLDRGQVNPETGANPDRIHLRAQTESLADLVVTELQARLPHIDARVSRAKNPLISFAADLPSVAEVGLGFDPAHFELAQSAGLEPVVRPIGYSWVQPEMVSRTLDQAAALGAKLIAVQGTMTPGFEFNLGATVDALKRNDLCYAYFRESRHQRGDWYVAKSLAGEGRVILAHEFTPEEMLLEDAGTLSYRWANLAVEGGVRLCCLRFFRVIHAGDPHEALDYVQQVAASLQRAGFMVSQALGTDVSALPPEQDAQTLSLAGLGIAGAAGLALDLLPLPEAVKLLGAGAGALALSGLPYLEQQYARQNGQHRHDHHHHEHDHGDHHHHHHDHHDHSHPYDPKTAYASKGLALAAATVFPAAIAAGNGGGVLPELARAAAAGAAGAVALNATMSFPETVLGVEEFRGYQLDWLLPLGAAAIGGLNGLQERGLRRWIPLLGVAATALALLRRGQADPLAALDREHRNAHTHHISAFQQQVGDAQMALSPRPLRKWSLLIPLGVAGSSIFKRQGRGTLAVTATILAALGGVTQMTGFRNAQRPIERTAEGRLRGWLVGLGLAGLLWLGALVFRATKRDS
jgi:hypothetical protein